MTSLYQPLQPKDGLQTWNEELSRTAKYNEAAQKHTEEKKRGRKAESGRQKADSDNAHSHVDR